ncbi:MAG: right-handed parallel beta-helix repeat-containing protein [candidate division SR1 bacterium]|nr:right-handed parallel beta-helix repeat-containing protein [candidate division SR1 bacterium]
MHRSFHHIHHYIRQQHKKYLLGTAIGGAGFFVIKLLVFVIGVLGLLQYSGTFASGGPACGGRDNSQFITGSFRDSNPDNNKIVCALYGDGTGLNNKTAYTQYRGTSTCITENMSVVYLSGGGLNTIPTTLTANTIYVLSGGLWTLTAARNINHCSAIVGKGDVTIQGAVSAGQVSMLSANATRNRILDNIKVDRNYTGAMGGNTALIIQNAASTSMTINNSQFYNAGASYNVYAAGGTYLIINNTQIYGGTVGIGITTAYTMITNSQIYNVGNAGFEVIGNSGVIDNCQVYNTFVGVRYNSSTNGHVLSNSQVYNNSYGVQYSLSNNNIITNTQIYNNAGYGIYFGTGDHNIINNTRSYNNGALGGISIIATSTNTKYYGANRVFNNGANFVGVTGNLITGSISDYPGLGRSDGSINTTAILTRDYITNPRNVSGTYRHPTRSSTFTALRATKVYTGSAIMQYSFGSGTLTQIQPVAYLTGSTPTLRGTFTTGNFIGGNTPRITGDLIGLVSGTGSVVNVTVTGTATSMATKYNIFGEVMTNILGVDINTSTGIRLTNGGLGVNRIITELYDPISYFAMHFEKAPILEDTGNDVFIDSSFWVTNPTTGDIIARLYGGGAGGNDKTAYTSGRLSNACPIASMVVSGVSPGTNTIPATLANYTIYVLESGTYLTTGTTTLVTCSAIIGKGNVIIQGSFSTNTRLLISQSKQNRILDNLKLNRNYSGGTSADVFYSSSSPSCTMNNVDAYGGYAGLNYYSADTYNILNNSQAHDNANVGIQFTNNSSGNIINNVKAYKNIFSYGMVVTVNSINNKVSNSQFYNNNIGFRSSTADAGIIENSQFYNNASVGCRIASKITVNNSQTFNNAGNGFDLNATTAGGTVINNCQIYNNTNYGISVASPDYVAINNTQIYNNSAAGIMYSSSADSGIINNSQIYNNTSYGIYYVLGSNNLVCNSQIYNNGSQGINLQAASTNNKYYGIVGMFGNATNIGGTTANFITGSSSDFPGLGRSNGAIDTTPTMSRDYLTNPLNASGSYLLNWSGAFSAFRNKLSYTGTDGMQYSYGSGILAQAQPVLFSGTTLIASGVFTGTNYIGSILNKITGDLIGIVAGTGTAPNVTVLGTASSIATKYNIFGDIFTNILGVNINTNTGIKLTNNGLGINRIITQIYDPTTYFATHFEKSVIVEDTGNDIFIDDSFWSTNPTTGEIIARFYGGGVASNDKTAYTKYRGTNTCIPNNMTVSYLTGGGNNIIPTTLSTNTIYILGSGTYLQSAVINIVNCSAIIGQGNVVIQQTTSSLGIIAGGNQKNRILDNVGLYKSTNTLSPYGIYANGMTSTTINNIDISGVTGSAGVFYQLSNYSIINNAQIYNNKYGVQYYATPSDYNILTNSKLFNNSSDGVTITSSTGGIIDNCQIYNNGIYGIHYTQNARKNSLNNSQIYNNVNGILYDGTNPGNNVINNSQIYNNTNYGINFTSGSNNIFNNTWIYNNGTTGVYINAISITNKYYGTNKIFGNTSDIGGTAANLTAGLNGDYPALGRIDGILDQTNILSRDYFTNPKNNTYNYLSIRSGTFSSLRGNKIFTGTTGIQYSYGSGILTQAQPVLYNRTTLVLSGTFVGTNYIGSSIPKITGDIQGIGSYNGMNSIITGIVSSPATKYNIYGDLTRFLYGIDSNTSTGITFSGGLATGEIITQIYDPINYFATHFQKVANIDTTAPSTPILVSPSSGTMFSTGSVQLIWSAAMDTGIGIGGYIYQVSTDLGFSTIINSGTQTTTGISLNNLTNGTYYRRIAAYDNAGNTGTRSTIWNFNIIMISAPVVGIGYISSGITGDNGGVKYYKGIINIRASLSGTNITSCEYTINGSSRVIANIGVNYCEATNINPTTDISLQFRATNSAGINTGGIINYMYDGIGPTTPILLSPSSGTIFTTGNVILLRNGSTDIGAGLSGYFYQISTDSGFSTIINSGIQTTTGISLNNLMDGTYYRRIYAIDNVGNTGARSALRNFTILPAISFDITAPTALNIGNISVPEATQVIEKIFTGLSTYFTVSDYVGDDIGYYTTISMTNLVDGNGNILSNDNIAIKTEYRQLREHIYHLVIMSLHLSKEMHEQMVE